MNVSFSFEGRDFEITTKYSASRYRGPVLLVDGELTDVPVQLDGDPTDVMVQSDDDDDEVAWPENRPD